MSSDLRAFGLAEMLQCGRRARRAVADAPSMEEGARTLCRYLRDEFVTPGSGERQCVLVRVYRTLPFSALPRELRDFAEQSSGEKLGAEVKCLTLLGTAGDEEAWNDRRKSRAHRAIALPTPELVERAPMIAQLVRDFGLDLRAVVRPSKDTVAELFGKTYGIFYVDEAKGSPYIPAQEEFVERYGVRSVLGFGGSLRSGDLYAVILFSRVTVPRPSADRFRNVALDIKAAFFEFDETRVWEARQGAAARDLTV